MAGTLKVGDKVKFAADDVCESIFRKTSVNSHFLNNYYKVRGNVFTVIKANNVKYGIDSVIYINMTAFGADVDFGISANHVRLGLVVKVSPVILPEGLFEL